MATHIIALSLAIAHSIGAAGKPGSNGKTRTIQMFANKSKTIEP
jgi:hypothetical protein